MTEKPRVPATAPMPVHPAQAKNVRRAILRAATALLLAGAAVMGPNGSAVAFSDKEARELFAMLDANHDGKVTRVEFEGTKMNAFYFHREPSKSGSMEPLTFEQTRLSRAFFDKADTDHDGSLDGVEINDAIRFEDIDTRRRGYFDFADFVMFLNKIGR